MKCLLLSVFLVLFLAELSHSAGKKKVNEGCRYKGKKIAVGETYNPIGGRCVSLHCRNDGTLAEVGCTYTQVPYECEYIHGDSTVAYPRCCPTYSCGKEQ